MKRSEMEPKPTPILSWALILCLIVTPVHGKYYSTKIAPRSTPKEKVTNLHFFFHDTLGGKHPTAVLVAKANTTKQTNSALQFGSVYAVDDPLTVDPDPTSEVIGNAQGLYVLSGQDTASLVVYIDFGFTKGEFNGSSISVFSRNPVMEEERELAVVGGRGKFRMARGFAQLKTHSETNDDAIVEYHVTLFHY